MAVEMHSSTHVSTSDARPAPSTTVFPSLPEIGHPEMFYAKLAKHAEHKGDHHLHEAAKVGQYITLALDRSLSWQQKLRYFRHALDRIGVSPDEAIMVGDKLTTDIKGANGIGMRSVWINHHGATPPEDNVPTYEITALAQLPDLIASLSDR